MTSLAPPALRQVGAAVRAFLVLTVLLGLAYPLVMTGVAQVLFPGNADGSLVESGDSVVGSELIGQSFARPVTEGGAVMDAAYFQSRPSAAGTGYDTLATSASHLGPENAVLIALVEDRRAVSAELDGVDGAQVPPDALLASGSGLDPHISPEYAAQQVARVSRERGLEPEQVRRLVDEHSDGRFLGFLGAPHVNVLMLNLALDELTGTPDQAYAD